MGVGVVGMMVAVGTGSVDAGVGLGSVARVDAVMAASVGVLVLAGLADGPTVSVGAGSAGS
jgi:hypothetical protein